MAIGAIAFNNALGRAISGTLIASFGFAVEWGNYPVAAVIFAATELIRAAECAVAAGARLRGNRRTCLRAVIGS